MCIVLRKRFTWRLNLNSTHVRTQLGGDNYENKQLRHSCTFKRASSLAKLKYYEIPGFSSCFCPSWVFCKHGKWKDNNYSTVRDCDFLETLLLSISGRVMLIFSINLSCLKDLTMMWRCVSGFEGWNFNVSWWKSKRQNTSMNQLLIKLTGDAKRSALHSTGRLAVRFKYSHCTWRAKTCFRLMQKRLYATAQNFEQTTDLSGIRCRATPISTKEKEFQSWWCSTAGQSAQSLPFERKMTTTASN